MVFLRDILKDWRTWVILIALLIWWLLSGCTEPEPLSPVTRYEVKKGRHDFRPNLFILPGEARDIEGIASFDTSCWYSELGADNADWNKLIGVYRYADVKKNINAFILAFRPDPERHVMQLCLYENIAGKNVPNEGVIYRVRCKTAFSFYLAEINGKYTLYVNNYNMGEQENPLPYRVVGLVGTWFGGNRVAPKNMWLYLYFTS